MFCEIQKLGTAKRDDPKFSYSLTFCDFNKNSNISSCKDFFFNTFSICIVISVFHSSYTSLQWSPFCERAQEGKVTCPLSLSTDLKAFWSNALCPTWAMVKYFQLLQGSLFFRCWLRARPVPCAPAEWWYSKPIKLVFRLGHLLLNALLLLKVRRGLLTPWVNSISFPVVLRQL